jgi:hypothetical protein
MHEPDEKLLAILKQDFPNQYSYTEKNGAITHLHILFSPSLLPDRIIDLESLEEITTEYDPKIEESLEYERNCFGEDKPIVNDFEDFLDGSQIRGVELWESEYNAVESLQKLPWIYHNLNIFPESEISSEEMTVCIRNGHVVGLMLELPNGWRDIEEMIYFLDELTRLQHLILYVEDSELVTKKDRKIPWRVQMLANRVDVEYFYDDS